MIRSFVAISIPMAILEQIEITSSRMRGLGLNARFPKAESIHLTLKFLGNIEETFIDGIGRALEASVCGAERFSLDIKGMGVFPNRKRPRIVWMGVEAGPKLGQLQQRVEKNLHSLGFEMENRPFKPHLTVARLKSPKNAFELRRFLEEEGEDLELGSFEVDAIHLYQSILRPSGAEYRKLSTHELVES